MGRIEALKTASDDTFFTAMDDSLRAAAKVDLAKNAIKSSLQTDGQNSCATKALVGILRASSAHAAGQKQILQSAGAARVAVNRAHGQVLQAKTSAKAMKAMAMGQHQAKRYGKSIDTSGKDLLTNRAALDRKSAKTAYTMAQMGEYDSSEDDDCQAILDQLFEEASSEWLVQAPAVPANDDGDRLRALREELGIAGEPFRKRPPSNNTHNGNPGSGCKCSTKGTPRKPTNHGPVQYENE